MTERVGEKVLVVLSGGQDSTTCLFWARERFDEVHAVTFDYNQRHRREIDAARKVARLAGVASHEVVEIGAILNGRSPLTNPEESLEQYDSPEQMEEVIGDRIELTFVPMRNALFLVLAANRAVCMGIDHIVTGVCQMDNANYPDCRQSFIDSAHSMINEALGRDFLEDQLVYIHTPLMNVDKATSVHLAMSIPGAYSALAYSHTSYDGAYPPTGKDHATVLRADGFAKAGVPDPLVVRAIGERVMEVPSTPNYSGVMLQAARETIKHDRSHHKE